MNKQNDKIDAFEKMDSMIKKRTVTDYDAVLTKARDEKYNSSQEKADRKRKKTRTL